MENDCRFCNQENECQYPHKPCACVGERKFWGAERRLKYDGDEAKKRLESIGYDVGKELAKFYVRLEGLLTRNT